MNGLTDKPEDIYREYKAPHLRVEEAHGRLMWLMRDGGLEGIMGAAMKLHQASVALDESSAELDLMSNNYYLANKHELYEMAIIEFYINNGLEPPAQEWHAENVRY